MKSTNPSKRLIPIQFFLSFCILFAVASNSFGQTEPFKHKIYLEIGGATYFGSINYEYEIKSWGKFSLSPRIGFLTLRQLDYENSFNPELYFPLIMNAVYGSSHKFEIGIGQLLTSIPDSPLPIDGFERATKLHSSFNIGYRYQSQKGYLFRAAYTPTFIHQSHLLNWIGFSFGYAF